MNNLSKKKYFVSEIELSIYSCKIYKQLILACGEKLLLYSVYGRNFKF